MITHEFKRFELHEYIDAGCPQLKDAIGVVLHNSTNGKICDGCPEYNNGQCEAYKKMISRQAGFTPVEKFVAGETVRQEAKRRGISIKQVRRERRDSRAMDEYDGIK